MHVKRGHCVEPAAFQKAAMHERLRLVCGGMVVVGVLGGLTMVNDGGLDLRKREERWRKLFMLSALRGTCGRAGTSDMWLTSFWEVAIRC